MTINGSANGQNDPNWPGTTSVTILTFYLAGQGYGLPVTAVRQLIEMVMIVELPQAPPAIQGVINVRGQIVPVMDLRLHFGLDFLPYQLHTPIILVEVNGRALGLIVDQVETVLEITAADMQPYDTIFDPDTNATFNPTAYLTCIAKVNHRIVPILNVSHILHHHEEIKLAHLLAESAVTDGETEPQPELEPKLATGE